MAILAKENVHIKLFDKSLRRNEIFEFLIGNGEYEIRCQHAEMPTEQWMYLILLLTI